VLPYHRIGVDKYARLSGTRRAGVFDAPEPERIDEVASVFRSEGLNVRIGG
jgi:hypothetical protein